MVFGFKVTKKVVKCQVLSPFPADVWGNIDKLQVEAK